MCGIAGVVSRNQISSGTLLEFSRSLQHRGPDDEGIAVLESGNRMVLYRGDDTIPELGELPHVRSMDPGSKLALVHRRLSILDLSVSGHQPQVSQEGNLALVFNGEIYNFVEIANELGHVRTPNQFSGDTRTLLTALERWGVECVSKLRGMWAFAYFDKNKNELILCRDRFGIKPLYYTLSDSCFAFASEIKALLDARVASTDGELQKSLDFIAHGRIDDSEETLFKDVKSLLPGSIMKVDLKTLGVSTYRYYDIGATNIEPYSGNLNDAVREYRVRFEETIRIHLRSDVPVGACLSGGLDSNLIAATASRQCPGLDFHTFTASFSDPAFDETEYVVLHGQKNRNLIQHFIQPSAEDLSDAISKLVRMQDHPLKSSSPFAQWMVMKLAASQGAKVLLDGQGADEAIGGYSYFAGVHLLGLFKRLRLFKGISECVACSRNRKINPGREIGRAVFHQMPLIVKRLVRRFSRLGPSLIKKEFRQQIVEREDRSGGYTDYCINALTNNLSVLLRYEDRNSMAFSIESRVPFLDHQFVEFVLSLPPEYKFCEGWSKFVQRKASEAIVPDEITWRKDKLGFATPQAQWKQELENQQIEWMRTFEIPFFLDNQIAETIIGKVLKDRTHLSEFWQLIFFLKWIEEFGVTFSD